jgi:hypothetical protein
MGTTQITYYLSKLTRTKSYKNDKFGKNIFKMS